MVHTMRFYVLSMKDNGENVIIRETRHQRRRPAAHGVISYPRRLNLPRLPETFHRLFQRWNSKTLLQRSSNLASRSRWRSSKHCILHKWGACGSPLRHLWWRWPHDSSRMWAHMRFLDIDSLSRKIGDNILYYMILYNIRCLRKIRQRKKLC